MHWYSVLFCVWMMIGCQEQTLAPQPKPVDKQTLIENNKKAVRIEKTQIEGFIKRRGWDMTTTKTGLRYMIYDSTSTQHRYPKDKDKALVNYVVKLIDGTIIYQSEAGKPATFIVGKDNVESGLQEGILFLQPGQKAILIMPAHLAHGFTGDFHKIPRTSSVIFDIELVDLQ